MEDRDLVEQVAEAISFWCNGKRMDLQFRHMGQTEQEAYREQARAAIAKVREVDQNRVVDVDLDEIRKINPGKRIG